MRKYQSAYRIHHGTETALNRIHNDILQSLDRGCGAIMVMLDPSAALDTIDQGISVEGFQKSS